MTFMPERDKKLDTGITITEKSLKEVPKAHSKYDERPYGIEDSRHIYYHYYTPKGSKTIDYIPYALCNFTALIKEEIVRDDGVSEEMSYLIDISLCNGSKINRIIEVPVIQYKSLDWVEKLGARFQVYAGNSSQERLKDAIKFESGKRSIKTRKIFTHTGWREINGEMYYLSGNGALGNREIGVELAKEEFQNYCLTEPIGDPVEAIRESLQSFFLAPRNVTIPLWTAMYMAPLTEFCPQMTALVLWLDGETGTMKSSMISIFMNHHGNFLDKTSLPASWEGTENALEEFLFFGKDTVNVIDDAAPPPDKNEKMKRDKVIERIIRAQGNRSGRIRMNMPRRFPRGVLITNGEIKTGGHSRNARILYLYIKKGDANTLFMNRANRALYCKAMSFYITWLKENWPRLKKYIPERFFEIRNQLFTGELLGKDVHNRIPEMIAGLWVSFETAMDFCLEKKAVNKKEAEDYRTEAWNIFLEIGRQQAILVEAQKAGRRFLDILKTMYAMGNVQFLPRDAKIKPVATSSSPYVGWTDISNEGETIFYLEMSAAIKAVRDFDPTFTWDEDSVKKSLASMDKIFASGENRLTKQLRVGVPIVEGQNMPRTVCLKGLD
jgi:hypothetical protein